MRQKHSEFRRHTTHTQYILPLQIVRGFNLSCLVLCCLVLHAHEHSFETLGLFKGMLMSMQNKTRQDKTKQDKTRQDKTRQDKTRQDKTRQDKTRQDLNMLKPLTPSNLTNALFVQQP